MEKNYKILKFSPDTNEFVVCYYTNSLEDGISLNLPLPVNDFRTGFLQGDRLQKYIEEYCPNDHFVLSDAIKTFDTSHIDEMVYDPLGHMTPEQRKAYDDDNLREIYKTHLSEMVDRVALSKDYDDFNSLMGWASSGNEKCANEAKIAIAWKEEVYDIWYKHWNAYIDDGVPLPAWEDMMKEFPEIIW